MPTGDAPRVAGPSMARAPLPGQLDFSDYLELRRARDAGRATDEERALLTKLERTLPVPFADAIPHMLTLADAPAPPPRELTRESLRVAFAMREEYAQHGATRHGLHVDLPEGMALKDWLEFMETERRHSRATRAALRDLDKRIWAMMSGTRRMPVAAL